LPAAFAERAASLIPQSSVVTLDTGHFIPLEKPNDVADCLRSFFAENRTTMDLPARESKKQSARLRTVVAEPLSLDGHRPVAVVS
jgi:hypothetical protein